jgi:trehalose 6-phosphate phosphatase
MQPILSPQGDVALVALLARQPLIVFDFDGTLAPIVPRHDEARISDGVTLLLRQLAARLPVAIVTGRALADVRSRLAFEPRFVVGNHGAEDEHGHPDAADSANALRCLRTDLHRRAAELVDAGVLVEDKGLSLAFHYRLAPDARRAQTLIHEMLEPCHAALRVFAGKMVVNAMAVDAPDKAQAVHRLVERCGAGAAFFIGDDVNDEPVFEAAPEEWLTVRVGRPEGSASQARYCLDDPDDMVTLLDRLLLLHGALQEPARQRSARVQRRV